MPMDRPVTFDWKINFGNVISLVSILTGGIFFAMTVKADVQMLSVEVSAIRQTMQGMSQVLIQVAVTQAKLENLEKTIEEIRTEQRRLRSNNPP